MKRLIILIRPYSKFLLIIWVLTIVSVSSVAYLPSPRIEAGGVKIRLDYLFHFCEYGLLAFLTFLTFADEGFHIGLRKYLITIISLILFAVADEFHQKLIPARTFNVKDIISNMAGIVAAFIFCLIMFRRIAEGCIKP